MRKALYRSFVELSGNRINSLFLKKFTKSRMSKNILSSFAKTYKINENEMEKTLSEYQSLHDLFTRKLKPGSRTIDDREEHAVSPVDGVLASAGKISPKAEFVVKGQTYSLEEMLGNKTDVSKYNDGYYLIFYLSPRHYHRIHNPISGSLEKQWTLGGKSYPVNEYGLTLGKRPLSRNYRLISEIKSGNKHMAMVKVGALNVNSIELTHESDRLNKGEEIGYFAFGSTVVLLFEKGMFSIHGSIKVPAEIQMGTSIGTITNM